MASTYYFVTIALLALASTVLLVHASDPSPLQDFCVAVNDAVDGGMYMLSLSLSLSLSLILKITINTYYYWRRL